MTTHTKSRQSMPLIALFTLMLWLHPFTANAECGDDYYSDIYNGDCDFKNEDSQLWLNQTGWTFQKEDSSEEVETETEQFTDRYKNTVKLTGDGAIRYFNAAVAITTEVAAAEAAIMAVLAAEESDPYELKELYVDVICEAFWQALMERGCVATSDLIISIQQMLELQQVADDLRDVIKDPSLLLGEEWGDLYADIQAMRSKYKSLETMAKNIDVEDIQATYQEKFSDLAQMLTQPMKKRNQYDSEIKLISKSLNDSTRDNLIASHANYQRFKNSDKDELNAIRIKNNFALGRMQATEVGNLLGSQQTETIIKISEIYMSMTNMMALDMAQENWRHNVGLTQDFKSTAQIDPINNITILNDGVLYK